ncbi:hypothetical protein Tcan_01921 [Toxocara canis]|uniref:Uncharacterized protein n=1 Tax=Toxocara canis TaxID=6265 RepID=A0A0B2UUH2_TOXCA|nr:hypothetical protein Tcan_01921 [Toxocara canis]
MGYIDFKTRNVIHLALGFICVFFAFNSQGFIEQTVISNAAKEGQIDSNAGYYRLRRGVGAAGCQCGGVSVCRGVSAAVVQWGQCTM